MKIKKIFLLIPFLLLTSCGQDTFTKADKVKVMIENGEHFTLANGVQEVQQGEDATFTIYINASTSLVDVSYPSYHIENETSLQFDLVLEEIQYPVVVTLTMSTQKLTYDGMGGTSVIENIGASFQRPFYGHHLRENSVNGYLFYEKEGYLPLGWNTKEDYSGDFISFGSRIPYDEYSFYLEWVKESDPSLFEVEDYQFGVKITSYLGNETEVVIPSVIQEKNVIAIAGDAFQNKNIEKLVLGNNILRVEDHAFDTCTIEEMYFCDGLSMLYENSFPTSIKKVHINATTSPKFSGTYYDTFPDKIDYLISIQEKKKLVLFSGSSTRYGFNSPRIQNAFPDYHVINMGVYAYYQIQPQLDIITAYLQEGDVLLSAPEFDPHGIDYQFGVDTGFAWNLFASVESDYDLLKHIDVSQYPDFFSSFAFYQEQRRLMQDKSYAVQAKHYDDNENYYSKETYNIQGDFILEREGNATDSWLVQPLTDYTLNGDGVTKERVEVLNSIYQNLLDQGIDVLFTYAPKNNKDLTADSTIEKRAEVHEYLKENLIVPVISELEDSLYPGTYFYLIDNHLSSLGAEERTSRIIRDLEGYLS